MTDAHRMEELRSPKALVCHQQHRADCGVGTVYFVVLADGYLIDCGAESLSKARAHTLAEMINASDPDRLSKQRMVDEIDVPF
jgi:hypothetical protein